MLYGKKNITEQYIHKAYKTWGYDVHSLEDVELLEEKAKVFENNHYAMVPYITENNVDMLLQVPYQHLPLYLPRNWRSTAYYNDELMRRTRMLPETGITATYINAADIIKIKFKEIFHNDCIILLYRIYTKWNGEFSGFFNTRTHFLYSIFENTNQMILHDNIENFILENYYILTCNPIIDRKKIQPCVNWKWKTSRKNFIIRNSQW